MSEKPVLRDFMFFDRQQVENYLSSIEGGITKERTETQRRVSGGAKAQVSLGVLKAGGSLEKKGLELTELKDATDASLFQRLYDHLKNKNMIYVMESIDERTWEKMERGDILEIEGRIEYSSMENLLEIMAKYSSLIVSQGGIDPRMYSILTETWCNQGFNIKMTIKDNEKFKIIATLPKRDNCIRVTKQEFEGEHTLFCRVQKKLRTGETFDLFSLIPGTKLDRQSIDKIITPLSNASTFLGRSIKVEDFRISYPAMIVTPIAIYR